MHQNPDIKVEDLSGVGEKLKLSFNKLSIFTLKDLIYFLPKRIVDLTNIISIAKAKSQTEGQAIIKATVKDTSIIRSKVKHMWITEALLEDESGAIEAIWFNQPFMHKNLKKGDQYVFHGNLNQNKNKLTLISPDIYSSPGIFPVYKQLKNLSSKKISSILKKVIRPSIIPKDIIPSEIIKQFKILDLLSATEAVHFPKSEAEFKIGRYRFLFEELFLFALTNQYIKNQFEMGASYQFEVSTIQIDTIIKKLPFKLTSDQKKVFEEISKDLESTKPMNRIIQGDVGSGKTIIAFLSCVIAASNGAKCAFMAPTQILANQHFENFKSLADSLNLKELKIALVTGKRKEGLQEANLFIGTHALINKQIDNLGLVIVDEQQRFGVEQRKAISEKGHKIPHYLSLSATPIPRSLFHVIFSNCDLSIIKEKPKGRQKIETFLIPEDKREDAYTFVNSLIAKGQQAFVVCPLVNDDLSSEKKSVEAQLKVLNKTLLKNRKIALLHGKQSGEMKEKIMLDFKNKMIDVLVSTSIVEVGIDIKDASVMIIENAESFGLSQLHQFRGRVGRGGYKSYCFAFSNKLDNPISKQRIKSFIQNDDGFELANYDLKLRGPGAFFNTNQSGFNGINPLWFEDSKLLKDATEAAKTIVNKLDKYPQLKSLVTDLSIIKRLE